MRNEEWVGERDTAVDGMGYEALGVRGRKNYTLVKPETHAKTDT